jgi:3,4-dehydroadipyl-CoA semialdehyde dehydrogenase
MLPRTMKTLASYVCGKWASGGGTRAVLVNPTTEEPVAETSTHGVDLGAALEFARDRGGPALRALSFAQRGEILAAMAKIIHAGREELIALAIENGGNTRGDAKFDIDGASATLAAYADVGAKLGAAKILLDGEPVQIGRTARLVGQHVRVPRQGVAVHVNAFNFPAWGLAEKAATALLAGMPVVSKPATATAVVAHRLMEMLVDGKVLPEGALSFIAGGAGDLLSRLRGQDVLAFTGSSDTARTLRAGEGVVAHSVHVNVEADSLNAAVLGPDVALGSETGQLFLADVARDLTQKTGQKCTAIRRVFVPEALADEVAEALVERISAVLVGDPADEKVRMGPLATAAQLADVRRGIARLAAETQAVYGGVGDFAGLAAPQGVAAGKGFFVSPVLRRTETPAATPALHEHEVFGPVQTIAVYSGEPGTAADLVQRGAGGLVASVYSDDRGWLGGVVGEIAAFHGRIYIGSAKMAAQSPGPGTVLPQLVHGGPGRAGGGEELGGENGMRLYQQRVALEGDPGLIKAIVG